MINLTLKFKRHEDLHLTTGRCRGCRCKQVFHLEPEKAEFKAWISFCMNCDGAAVFDLVTNTEQ